MSFVHQNVSQKLSFVLIFELLKTGVLLAELMKLEFSWWGEREERVVMGRGKRESCPPKVSKIIVLHRFEIFKKVLLFLS